MKDDNGEPFESVIPSRDIGSEARKVSVEIPRGMTKLTNSRHGLVYQAG